MKRTSTMIFSLALAIILVSSLSSGVLYGDDRRGRDFDVVILDCGIDEFDTPNFPFEVTAINHNNGDVLDEIVEFTTTCVEGIAVLLKARFKMENSSGGFNTVMAMSGFGGSMSLFSRYTFVRTLRGPRDNEE